MVYSRLPTLRLVVWALASISFVCLLGEFYGTWKMKSFACFALLPAMIVLAWMALAWRKSNDASKREVSTLLIEGALGGLLAAIVYDLYRLPFVMSGYPLFKVFPEFGKMLLGASDPNWLVQLLGWSYHFSNGASLGIMFTMMCGWSGKRVLFWGAAAWALAVECILLMTPYRNFFKIAMPFETFLVLTATAHLIFGLALGTWCAKRLQVPNSKSMSA
jgi:uncharacterized membrane protein YoaK (UPF0700 family)